MAEKLTYEPAIVTGSLQIGPVTTPGEEYVYIDEPADGGSNCGALISHTQSGWFTPTD